MAADRRKIMEEKKALLIKKREKEKLLNLLQAKNELGDLVRADISSYYSFFEDFL